MAEPQPVFEVRGAGEPSDEVISALARLLLAAAAQGEAELAPRSDSEVA